MKTLTGSITWKLTIWFLLLSVLPIAVMAIFVRQNVADTIEDLAADDTLSQVTLLANELSASVNEGEVQALLSDITNQSQSAFLIGENGVYVAHPNGDRVGRSVFNDFPAEVAEKLVSGEEGIVIEEGTGRLIGFSRVPTGFSRAVLVVDGSAVSVPVQKIERSAFFQLALSLALIAVAGGVAIWIFFRPIQRLSRAAEQIGAGNLEVELDSFEMEGELEILARSFNTMTSALKESYAGLEQRVADRTEELRESNQTLRTLIQAAPLPILAIDRDANIRMWNPAAERIFGWTEQEVLGHPLPILFPEGEEEQARAGLERVMGGEALAGLEVRRQKKDGSPVDVGIWTAPLRGAKGDITGVMGVIADLTERKQAEEALRDSEERYRTLFVQSRDAIFISSLNGEIIDANQAALDLFGFAREEAIGSDVGERFADSTERERFRREMSSGSVRNFEVKLRKKDGTELDCLMAVTRQMDEEGNSLGVQGIIHDITELKQAEEALRDLAVLEERNRMAREIHDTLAQGFTGIVLQLEAGEQALEQSPADVTDHIARAKGLARESLQEARRSVWNLLPQALEERPLDGAL